MPKTLIASNPSEIRKVSDVDNHLQVAEFFCDTIQGEGITAGHPSTFLRLKGCTLDCIWCDTAAVWKHGNPYTFNELYKMMEWDTDGLIDRFRKGQHLILTGGSPLKQQDRLVRFIEGFQSKFGFLPYIEVENEAVLRIKPEFAELVSQWNNSPKLANSGMKSRARYKPDVLAHTAKMTNSWFKFVVEKEEDWEEIQMDFIDTGICSKKQVIVMPCGEDQKILSYSREIAANIAVEHQVKFSDRLHITIWDKKTGV